MAEEMFLCPSTEEVELLISVWVACVCWVRFVELTRQFIIDVWARLWLILMLTTFFEIGETSLVVEVVVVCSG